MVVCVPGVPYGRDTERSRVPGVRAGAGLDYSEKAEGGIRNERGCESGADDAGKM